MNLISGESNSQCNIMCRNIKTGIFLTDKRIFPWFEVDVHHRLPFNKFLKPCDIVRSGSSMIYPDFISFLERRKIPIETHRDNRISNVACILNIQVKCSPSLIIVINRSSAHYEIDRIKKHPISTSRNHNVSHKANSNGGINKFCENIRLNFEPVWLKCVFFSK